MTDDAVRPPGDPAGGELVGTILAGRYRILGILGRGAMGTVYLGQHIRMGRKTALKILSAGDHDPGSIARFTRGAQNAALIDHPNVCRVFDFGDPPGGLHFLAMEFIEGASLYDIIAAEGSLDPERALSIAIQIASALQAAHDLGIVHRDLKPGNIMVTSDPQGAELVKVVDFDIAKAITARPEAEVTTHGWLVGTPEYMSPEQFMGGALDGRSDIYSLGVIVFRMLTGMFPFSSTTAREIMWERLHEQPMTLEEASGRPFPGGLQAALDGALRVAVEERWGSASAFREALNAALLNSSQGHAGASPLAAVTPAASDEQPWATPPTWTAGGDSSHSAQSAPRTVASPRGQAYPPEAVARPRPAPRWRRPAWAGVIALLTVGIGYGAWKLTERPPVVERPIVGQDATVAGPEEEIDDEPAGPAEDTTERPDTTRSRPQADETDTFTPSLPVFTAAAARDTLAALHERLGQLVDQEGDVRVSVGSDVAGQARTLFDRLGDDPALQANAAYVLSMALCEQGRSAEARTWAVRSDQLNPSPSNSVWLEFLSDPAFCER